MRTTDSRRPAGKLAAALRSRTGRGGAGALVAGALVFGAASAVTAEAATASGITGYKAPSQNFISTASFEKYISPWSGTRLHRQAWSTAPAGSSVARVYNRHGRVILSEWPGSVKKSIEGAKYTARVRVAAGRSASMHHPITLVIREHGPKGAWVAGSSATTYLWWKFRTLSVTFTAKRWHDAIDVYVYERRPSPHASFVADDVSLTAQYPIRSPAPTPPPSGSAASTLGLLAYATGQPTALGNTSRYAYVVVQENQFAHIAEVKRMNPRTKVLAYMNTNVHYYDSCPNTTDPHLYGESYGVSYCWANRAHPDWFLKDHGGNRLHLSDYPFAMPMDVGNTSFADTWAAGTYANLKRDGFDGVWIDDVNIDPGHGLNGRIAMYSDAAYGAATTRWASRVGDYFRGRGMVTIDNVGGILPWDSTSLNNTLTIGRHLTAVNREHFVRYGDICGPFGERFNTTANTGTPPLWTYFDLNRKLQAQGSRISGVDYGYTNSNDADYATMTYGRAMFLLSWDGKAGSAYFYRRCGVNDTANPRWTADLGLPTGPLQTIAGGLYTRKFQHGMVVLNPNRRGTAAKVSVPAGLHSVSGATADGGVYVAPQTAAILSS